MRLALVTTPPSARSGIGDYTRRLLEHLGSLAEVRVFVEPGLEGERLCGLPTESAHALRPREHDQVLFQLGNETRHAFMVPLVRAIGGVVCLHDWVLFDLAVAAAPELAKGGWRGHLAALKAGGPGQLAVYRANWRDRRRTRTTPYPTEADVPPGPLEELDEVVLVSGWHASEASGAGRWTADRAVLELPAAGCRRLQLSVTGDPGRTLRVTANGTTLEHSFGDGGDWGGDRELELELASVDRPRVELHTEGLSVTRAQCARGDSRRLGIFVRDVRFEDDLGWHAVDLQAPAASPVPTVSLDRDRFDLPLNRPIVRWADAFFVHSETVGHRIIEERNAPTPVIVLPHGTERRWRQGDRRDVRASLSLPADWREAFLVTSFGALQAHKRLDVLLEGFALALEDRPGLRLALVGRHERRELDVRALIARHGLADHVHLAGFVEEQRGLDFLHAADLVVQLRGPSTGGSSGGVHQAFSAGRGVVVSDLEEQAELPAGCTRRLAPGPGEAGRLADLLTALHDDPAARESMEREARRFVEEQSRFELVAERYLEALERFPRPRGRKKRMFAQRVRQRVADRRS